MLLSNDIIAKVNGNMNCSNGKNEDDAYHNNDSIMNDDNVE